MERAGKDAAFIRKYKEYGITAEVIVLDDEDAIDVILHAHDGEKYQSILIATGPITDDNKKEAKRIQNHYVNKYGFKRRGLI